MSRKVKVFIASSSEGLIIANAIKEHVSKYCDVTLWSSNRTFKLSDYPIESLERAANSSEYGIFVFTPDDKISSRKKSGFSARDNVVFEYGLFLGKLSKARTCVVADSQVKEISDLKGLTIALFDWKTAKVKDKTKAALKEVSDKILDAINDLPTVESPGVASATKLEEVIGDKDELYRRIIGHSPKRSGVIIFTSSTEWEWKLFPTILEWRLNNVPTTILLEKPTGDKKSLKQEAYRRKLLKNLGCHIIERDSIPFQAFCLDCGSSNNLEVIVLNTDTTGCRPYALRYTNAGHTTVATTLRDSMLKIVGKSPANYVPKVSRQKIETVVGTLKSDIPQYRSPSVVISYATVSTRKLKLISKYTRDYKYTQISNWQHLYKKAGLKCFEAFRVRLKDGTFTIATPPVVEKHGKDYVVIEGNTRATLFYKQKIKKFPCLLITGVTDALPSVPLPIKQVLLSKRELPPTERMRDFDFALFRPIEKAMHPYD